MSENDKLDGGVEHKSGTFLGEFRGLRIPGNLEDSGQPVLEIHGEENMAAVEMTEKAVEGLTEAAAEIRMALDEGEVSAE